MGFKMINGQAVMVPDEQLKTENDAINNDIRTSMVNEFGSADARPMDMYVNKGGAFVPNAQWDPNYEARTNRNGAQNSAQNYVNFTRYDPNNPSGWGVNGAASSPQLQPFQMTDSYKAAMGNQYNNGPNQWGGGLLNQGATQNNYGLLGGYSGGTNQGSQGIPFNEPMVNSQQFGQPDMSIIYNSTKQANNPMQGQQGEQNMWANNPALKKY